MALNALGMGIIFTAKDLASATVTRLNGRMTTLTGTTKRLGLVARGTMRTFKVGLASMAVGLVGLAVINKVTKATADFEVGLAKAGLIMQASTEDLAALKEAAIQAGIKTQFSPKEATEGLGDLAAQGFNATDAISALNPALDLAAGGQISVSAAAKTTAATLKVFGLDADQAAESVDKLLRISNATALQAGDLQISIANVSRGAIAAKQSLNEMLPALGLVKNSGVDASVAGTAVSSALQFMGKNADAIKSKLGVAITDSTGAFRPFLDIVNESRIALAEKFPDGAKRLAAGVKLFGRFGVGAITSISAQLEKGIKNFNGDIVKGAEAIEFLRSSMVGAKGAAKAFKDGLLDTLDGQKKLLKGSLETLAIVVGEPLAKGLRPIVEGITGAINKVIVFITKMDPKTKAFFGRVVVGGFALLTFGGAILTAVSAIGFILPALKAGAVAIASMTAGMLPFIAVAALVGAAVLALKHAIDNNIGGMGDKFHRAFDAIKLVVSGLKQLFSDGGFSGAVADELGKAENAGLLKFIFGVENMVIAVRGFLSGIAEGFEAAMQQAAPVFDALGSALDELGKAFDAIGGGPAATMKEAFDQGEESGSFFGNVIGKLATLLAAAFTIGVKVVTGFLEAWNLLAATFAPVTAAFGEIFDALGEVADELGLAGQSASESGSIFKWLGGAIASTLTRAFRVAAPVLRGIAGLIRSVATVFGGVVEVIRGISNGSWSQIWGGMKSVAVGAVNAIIEVLAALVGVVAGAIDGIAKMLGKESNLAKGVNGIRDSLLIGRSGTGGTGGAGVGAGASGGALFTPAGPALAPFDPSNPAAAFGVSAAPAVAAIGPQASFDPTQLASVAASAAARGAASAPPVVVSGDVTLNEEIVGTIMLNASKDNDNLDASQTRL